MSFKAYGVAACGKFSEANLSSFAMVNSQVTPLQQLTIHQLELTAASIAARLCSYINKSKHNTSLAGGQSIFFHWLHIASRVAEINSVISMHDWKYCLTTVIQPIYSPEELRPINSKHRNSGKLSKPGY